MKKAKFSANSSVAGKVLFVMLFICVVGIFTACDKEQIAPVNGEKNPTYPILSFTNLSSGSNLVLVDNLLRVGIFDVNKTTFSIDEIKISVEGVNENIIEDVFVSKNANLENEINFSGSARTNISTVSYYDKKIDTISLEAGINIFYLYVKIKNIVAVSENGKAISFNLTALTDVKSGNKIALDKNIAVNAGKINIPLYATIDEANSYISSDKAVDKFVVGKSVAEGFNLSVTKAGTAKVEVVGLKTDGGVPISHYWITNSVDEDFGVRVSTFNSNNNVIKGKTAVTNKSFTIDLVVGVNNVVFKTTHLYKAIASGTKVGLKITLANGVTYTSLYEAKSDSVDLADKVVVSNNWIGGVGVLANTQRTNLDWGGYQIYPTDDNYNFVNKFPKIMSIGMNTEYYATNYPYLDFTNKGNQSFRLENYYYTTTNIVFNKSKYDVSKNFIISYGNTFDPIVYTGNQYYGITLFLNVFNTSPTINFGKAVGLDPYKGGWKFYGNPEMEVRVTTIGGIVNDAKNLISYTNRLY